MATLFVIASHLAPVLELSFDDVPRHLKHMEKQAKAQCERARQLDEAVAALEARVLDKKAAIAQLHRSVDVEKTGSVS